MMDNLELRTIAPDERAAVLDLLAEWFGDRAFFARYFEHDRSFRDDLCFVAVDRGRIVSTLQVFRKQVTINGVVLQVGCVGNVFTTAAYRERGLASKLLNRAITAMVAHGFDLSLLFTTRLAFYGRLGWVSHVRHLVFIEAADVTAAGGYVIEPFATAALGGVMKIYERYTAGLNGPTVRDRRYWQGQLRYAGNPHEDFLIARAGADIVAYARGTTVYGLYVVMEHGHLPGCEAALTELVCRLHGTAAVGLPGTVTHLAIAPAVQQALRARGLQLRTVEDVFWMWRVISPPQVSAKLRVTETALATDDVFFHLLPPGESVYWIADRF